ncbi:RNA polymerase sigma factor [Pedobacter nanyangensis]|uniref:RNA polymerase sigma factor n=1 Tax=Pedobacter nanyangensis TaxID=1562389 RepID=UPI000DE2992B|nr:RNA polymerase sigma factor [Pedobacter nanyangensis]
MSDLDKEIAALVKTCVEGHRLSQERLYKMFYAEMWRTCIRYVKTDDLAREALNTAFLKVFQHMSTYDVKKGSLNAWMATIMIRTCIDLSRKECRFETTTWQGELPAEDAFVAPEILDKLYAQDLIKLIRLLPHATQMVFNLSVIDGYSHKEIAERLEIGEATSRWHLSEGKKQLRALLLKHTKSKTIHTENKTEKK